VKVIVELTEVPEVTFTVLGMKATVIPDGLTIRVERATTPENPFRLEIVAVVLPVSPEISVRDVVPTVKPKS